MSSLSDYQWTTYPDAAKYLLATIRVLTNKNDFARSFSRRFLPETGTRFFDWVDHVTLPEDQIDTLLQLGFVSIDNAYRHPKGMFPSIRIGSESIAIKIESLSDFIRTHRLKQSGVLQGEEGQQFRSWTLSDQVSFSAIERHGYTGYSGVSNSSDQMKHAVDFYAAIRDRPRAGISEPELFAEVERLISGYAESIGWDWACDVFFRAEREYWMSRNLAARIQKQRQDSLGLGWANHDHHTYRCSREHFARLIHVLELMGFQCREQFFAGDEAGWGAQVLEHPTCGIIIFADVDMTADEVIGDFSHEGLDERAELGTVGLWCKLHGESFLSAGLHHLECQFDFNAAREQLAQLGIQTMVPFTDFPHLQQAFTEGETWSVETGRIERLVSAGSLTPDQAEKFIADGAIGSHLEILERNDGYKGFNQTGISHIISKTDPRN